MTKKCLDLFSGTGGFSAAFEDSDGWEVTTVDIREDLDPDICADVMDLTVHDFDDDYDVIVASPPCQHFSTANHFNNFDNDGNPLHDDAAHSLHLIHFTEGLIKALNPDYWFMENPRSPIKSLFREPEGVITWCQYGDDVMKPTYLWGEHPPSFIYRRCKQGMNCHESSPQFDSNSGVQARPKGLERAKIPYGLSEAVLEAVENDSRRETEALEW